MKPRGPSGGRPRNLLAPGDAQPNWRDQAQCIGTEVEMYPSTTDYDDTEWREARAVCRGCPVTAQCLADAMAAEGSATSRRYGMWGGADPQQRINLYRNKIRTGRDPRPPAAGAAPVPDVTPDPIRHGTRHGAKTHRCTCDQCREWKRTESRKWRAAAAKRKVEAASTPAHLAFAALPPDPDAARHRAELARAITEAATKPKAST